MVFGSTGINGMETRIFEGVGDVHPPHLQKFGTFPAKNGRAWFFSQGWHRGAEVGCGYAFGCKLLHKGYLL